MKKYFVNLAVLATVAAFSAGVAVAAPLCSTVVGTVDVTTLNAGGGCTVGTFTFNDFQVSAPGVVGLVAVNNPGGGYVGLNFNPNLTNSAVLNDIHFLFSVTSSSASLTSAYLFNGATGGASSIGEEICNSAGVNLSGLCTGAPLTSFNATALTSNTGSFDPQTKIWVWKDINIAINSPTHLSSFDQNFAVSGVPEPATFSMLGLGLAGLGFLSRRMRKS